MDDVDGGLFGDDISGYVILYDGQFGESLVGYITMDAGILDPPYVFIIAPWMWNNGFTNMMDIIGNADYDIEIRNGAAVIVKVWQQKQRFIVGNPVPGIPTPIFWMDRMVQEYEVDRPGFAAVYDAAPTLSPYYVPTF